MNIGPYNIFEEFKPLKGWEQSAIDACNSYPIRRLMYRGVEDGYKQGIHVTSKGQNFRGTNQGSDEILKLLNVKNPAFTAWSPEHAKFFGRVYIFIPIGEHTIWQSKIVDDVSAWAKIEVYLDKEVDGETISKKVATRTKQETKDLASMGAKTYKKTDKYFYGAEAIIDTKEYFLINCIDDIKNYGELAKHISSTMEVSEWKRKYL